MYQELLHTCRAIVLQINSVTFPFPLPSWFLKLPHDIMSTPHAWSRYRTLLHAIPIITLALDTQANLRCVSLFSFLITFSVSKYHVIVVFFIFLRLLIIDPVFSCSQNVIHFPHFFTQVASLSVTVARFAESEGERGISSESTEKEGQSAVFSVK